MLYSLTRPARFKKIKQNRINVVTRIKIKRSTPTNAVQTMLAPFSTKLSLGIQR